MVSSHVIVYSAKGYGKKIIGAAVEYCHNVLGRPLIISEVKTDNEASLRMVTSAVSVCHISFLMNRASRSTTSLTTMFS